MKFSQQKVAKFAKQRLLSFIFLFLIGREKRRDLEQKIVRFGNKSHHWEPITLQG